MKPDTSAPRAAAEPAAAAPAAIAPTAAGPDDALLADAFDLQALPADFYADPYPTYHALRAHAPVKRLRDGSVFLTRYADVQAVYRDATTFSSDKRREFAPKYGADSALYAHHTTSLVFNDPPLHTRVRGLIMGALTLRAVRSMEPALVALVDRLLDEMDVRARAGQAVDLIGDYAAAIPVEVIGNLLGVPLADRAPLRGWSLAILGALEPALSPQQLDAGNRAVDEFLDYLKGLVADRRAHPGDPAQDVLTRLIQGEHDGETGGERLTEAELLHNCIFLLNAGHETTTNLIGNALEALMRWPRQKERLSRDPTLVESAVEEFLRYESSNQLGNRITTVACEVGGVPLAPGTPVHLCIGAANRDPERFEQPDLLDVARHPNRHLAFGFGVHQCAGLSLARLEGRVAIGRFVARFADHAPAGSAVRGGRARFRGFASLPATLRPAG